MVWYPLTFPLELYNSTSVTTTVGVAVATLIVP